MPQKVLIYFVHPVYENSRVNKVLIKHIPKSEHVTCCDLYERYPNFDIDVDYEKELLNTHDIIIWHHPLYWYSSPPLLKQWIDLVLEYGWAYGKGGTALKGKYVFQAITTGGSRETYCDGGKNCREVMEFLAPFEQTAKTCHMEYLPPFVVHGTHRLNSEELNFYGKAYGTMIEQLVDGKHLSNPPEKRLYLNDWQG